MFKPNSLESTQYYSEYMDLLLIDDDQMIQKFNDLYVTERRKYVLLRQKGYYETVTWYGKKHPMNEEGAKPLLDFMFKSHLNGWYTICVFASKDTTKFICFDVDVKGNNRKKRAQKAVRLLYETLAQYGIPKKNIYISSSGKKGYHVEIFFKNHLCLKTAKAFFDLIVNRPGLNNLEEANVEFRPTNTQAVKLPLGYNFCNRFKSRRFCCFVDINSGQDFVEIDNYAYFLYIEKINPFLIFHILHEHRTTNNNINNQLLNLNSTNNAQPSLVVDNETKKDNHYTANQGKQEPYDNNYSINGILKLEKEGLSKPGTRHNSLLKLAILFKDYYRLSQEDSKTRLIEWLKRQDKSTYTTSLDNSIKDIEQIVADTYNRDYKLKRGNSVRIYAEEIVEILKAKQKNAKLLLFALLVHNKKYFSVDGVFYMSYKQMSEATGLSVRTCIYQMKNLVAQNLVKVVGSKIPDNYKYYKPNNYRLLFRKKENVQDDDQALVFEYKSNTYVREYFKQGLGLPEDSIIKKCLPKKDYYQFKKKYIY